MLTIEIEHLDDHTVCRFLGEIDSWTVGEVREALAALIGEAFVVLDLSATGFMDSAGLGAIIGAVRRAREAGGDVAVACARTPLVRLLHTCGFDRVVAVEATVADAADALRDGALLR